MSKEISNPALVEWYNELLSLNSPENLLEDLDSLFFGYLESANADSKLERCSVLALYIMFRKLLIIK